MIPALPRIQRDMILKASSGIMKNCMHFLADYEARSRKFSEDRNCFEERLFSAEKSGSEMEEKNCDKDKSEHLSTFFCEEAWKEHLELIPEWTEKSRKMPEESISPPLKAWWKRQNRLDGIH